MNKTLKELLHNNPALWRAGEISKSNATNPSTGFSILDDVLPGNGWPANALTEIIAPHWGIGELQLLLPTLRRITQQYQYALWIAPPFIPYAASLRDHAVDLEYTLVLPHEHLGRECSWVMEKVLRAQACGIAMSWPRHLTDKEMRRLQLAAENGRSIGFVFRTTEAKSSPAALRLRLTALQAGLQIDVLKVRGGSQLHQIIIPLKKSFA